jgi:hypothetical protein
MEAKKVNRDIAANLDEQQNKLTALCAQDSARIRGTKEDRNAASLPRYQANIMPLQTHNNKVLNIILAQVWRELHQEKIWQ